VPSMSFYHTHIFSSSMTNELRGAYSRFKLNYPVDAANPLAATQAQIAIAGINTTGLYVYGLEATYPQGRLFNNYVLQDTMSLGVRYENFGLPMNVVLNPVYSGLFNVNPVTLDSPLLHPNKVAADNNNWGPTVGLAYSPALDSGLLGRLLGNRKSVFRIGYA